MASFGCTVLERMMSDISKFNAISSKLEDVALSICSSRAELEANQLDIFSCVVTAAGEQIGVLLDLCCAVQIHRCFTFNILQSRPLRDVPLSERVVGKRSSR